MSGRPSVDDDEEVDGVDSPSGRPALIHRQTTDEKVIGIEILEGVGGNSGADVVDEGDQRKSTAGRLTFGASAGS